MLYVLILFTKSCKQKKEFSYSSNGNVLVKPNKLLETLKAWEVEFTIGFRFFTRKFRRGKSIFNIISARDETILQVQSISFRKLQFKLFYDGQNCIIDSPELSLKKWHNFELKKEQTNKKVI